MGAFVDETKKPFFLLGNGWTETARMGAAGMLYRKDWSFIEDRPTRDDKKNLGRFAPTCHLPRVYSTITWHPAPSC
jgi:hypothetical protein